MCTKIIPLFGLAISICSIVYLFKVRSDTKNDLFQQPFELGKKEKLFFQMNSSSIALTEKLIKCELYQEAIMNPKVNKLGLVFNLNIEKIHKRTTQLIIVFFLVVLFIFLPFLMIYLYSKTRSLFMIVLTYIALLANYALYIANFVITVLLVLAFYKGDTYRFLDFLSCKNVNKDEFDDYLYARKIKNDFIIFIILNIVSSVINYQSNQFNPTNAQPRRKKLQGEQAPSEQPSIVVVDNKK